MMSKALAAGLGAVAVQIFSGLAPSRAAWGWHMNITEGGGFSCQEGNTRGGAMGSVAADYDCTVVPDDGMTCDVTTISIKCSDGDGGEQNFVPPEGACINDVTYAESNNVTPDNLAWSQVPVCTNTTTSGAAGKMIGCAAAAVLTGMAL